MNHQSISVPYLGILLLVWPAQHAVNAGNGRNSAGVGAVAHLKIKFNDLQDNNSKQQLLIRTSGIRKIFKKVTLKIAFFKIILLFSA